MESAQEVSMGERFEVIRVLGHGSFGEVVLARDRQTSQLVAIKRLIDLNVDARERFKREALHLYELLDNRHVVDLLEAHMEAEPPYLVLEYCEGGSLDKLLNTRHRWTFVAQVMLHSLIALYSIHAVKDGFHRDIKPHNLLLAQEPDGEWIVKVADFGYARLAVHGGSMTYGAAGTRGYIAPEVIMGENYHAGADIYSLGIVAVELLTMKRDPAGLLDVDAPPAFLTLVRRMTSREPSQRPCVDEALGLLVDLLKSSPPGPAPSGLPRPPLPPPPPAAGEKASPSDEKSNFGTALLTGLGIGAAVLAVAALLGGDKKTWDANVRRYRDRNGRFTS
ncbi:MAG: serine/threonine-protein kinase [Polyangiaceae bacterium]